MDTHPLFTVIIPAKNRARYLHHTLRTCALQDYDNLEVIVSDDGSTDDTRDVVEEAMRKDRRIRYVTPGAGAGMRANFEFALRQVRPGYVLALGADDGLLPHGISEMLELLRTSRQELAAWPAPVYAYPHARTPRGHLTLYRRGGERIVRSSEFLNRQAEHLHYLSDIESPMFYVKGVTSTRLVDAVRARSPDGRFYACPTPDGYSGLVLAGETPTFAFSGCPFTIYGVSPSSQGMNYQSGGEQAKKLSEDFFRSVADAPMHRQLASQPYSPLITLMTADYVLSLGDLPGWPGRFPPLDMKRVLTKSVDELAHGLYAEGRLQRELRILDAIAQQHGLAAEFRRMVSKGRRYAVKQPLAGDGISPQMVFLDADDLGIRDIVDAAHFARLAHRVASKATPGAAVAALRNSLRYKLTSMRRGDPFPDAATWQDLTP